MKPKSDPSTDSNTVEFKAPPVFILGCVRSGTTMLRNILRMHPNLASPEETHFFRWAEPFGTDAFARIVASNPVLKRHREIDGITEQEFRHLLEESRSRADLYHKYMTLFVQRRKPGATRWFDKTPQNVYGAAMIAASMPRVRFVHIVRNPINVVASLRIGRVMKVGQLVGACNYWNEAVDSVMVIKRAYPGRVHELRYEEFVNDPMAHLETLLRFIEEPFQADWFKDVQTSEVDHTGAGVLGPDDIGRIQRICAAGRKRYGYDDVPIADLPPKIAPPAPQAAEPAAAAKAH